MLGEPTILRDDRIIRIGSFHSVLFQVWVDTATPQALREVCELEFEYVKSQPGQKFALLSVIRVPKISEFGAEGRRALETRLQRIEPFLSAAVALLPTHSIAASIVRGIALGLSLVKRHPVPNTVAATASEACAWLAPHVPKRTPDEKVRPEDLLRALERVMETSS